jgi:hypothetical protein
MIVKSDGIIAKVLRALGLVRGNLDSILGGIESFASKLDAHAVQAGADRDYHDDQADLHSLASDEAHAEVLRASAVAKNFRQLLVA